MVKIYPFGKASITKEINSTKAILILLLMFMTTKAAAIFVIQIQQI